MEDGQQLSWSSSRKEQQRKYMKNSRNGFLTRYILNPWILFDGERLKKVGFGEKDESKPHKTIIMVGETGVGKSTLVNAMVNYMLGVDSTDRIWFEIIETKTDQSDSQTNVVTVYDIFTEHSPFSLTVIDTPGFGKTEGRKEDLKVSDGLLELFHSSSWVHEIDAVCLVVSSSTVRLTEKQQNVFNAVLSLFGNDVKKNLVVFITRAPTKSTNSLKAIKDAKIPCAQTDEEEPVHFRFDNCHCENFYAKYDHEEENEQLLQGFQAAWNLFNTSMKKFLHFLNGSKPVSWKNTENVLTYCRQQVDHISSLRKQVKAMQLKKMKLDQVNEALQQHEEKRKTVNFEYEMDEVYKEKVPIDPSTSSSKEATCCSVCEENCHYPGCWWVRDLSWCSAMSKGKCTVCTGRCDYTDHVKEAKIYVRKTRKVKKIQEDLKKKYKTESEEKKRWITQLEKEMAEQVKEITRLVDECHQCMHFLKKIALKTDAVSTLQDLDFLIQEAKETQRPEILKKLKELKKRAEEESKHAEHWTTKQTNPKTYKMDVMHERIFYTLHTND
ncbi:uncharacterized protein LOC132886372 [Neoarius graeffei]|uniref:uncharacterized protein LOC132886372 n=1 Tax=Neoarius graeffei TaxID=443677 RepID=UPI00298D232B|nr:uncharacterized protein LOC132886372 [Neoarius graeffei]XP_060776939.1 uncharacterized protein LOC132886372 [Neoarius graeffei]XP_060776940.1 uncharacterized protein LOC132886372 [Neoarius graeffei]XP_060776941.1 uncharacterized protein LOC132886372 [Neoarius graeffei]XP_060776942.1 uncharacterized protein LOC132886372 [Neoarius graeffei]